MTVVLGIKSLQNLQLSSNPPFSKENPSSVLAKDTISLQSLYLNASSRLAIELNLKVEDLLLHINNSSKMLKLTGISKKAKIIAHGWSKLDASNLFIDELFITDLGFDTLNINATQIEGNASFGSVITNNRLAQLNQLILEGGEYNE
jgi:hypothetical protein